MDLIAYRLGTRRRFSPPAPASRWRPWAAATREHFANRCLPLLVANQSGWVICTPTAVEILWRGGDDLDQLAVSCTDGGRCPATSHFGHGIVTWGIPFLFETPPGYNLLVRGPANSPKDGIAPLEGLVEADWAVSPFTMNWKVTRPNAPIRFEAGEPICMIVPQRRGELEGFAPTVVDLRDVPDVRDHFRTWLESRREFNWALRSGPVQERWQKHYFRGETPSGLKAQEHQTSLRLRGFSEASRTPSVGKDVSTTQPVSAADEERPPAAGSR